MIKSINSRPLRIGDTVQPYGYGGLMVISHQESPPFSGEPMWFCYSEEYDTHFDTYSESELTLIE